VPTVQRLLFPDPQPLVERLGGDFFRQLPEQPGVYLMRDANDTILYIGKAKNLRKRLGTYRVANPDRLPRRHLRLLRSVTRIEIQECPDEPAALAREADLLRTVRPRFNRAGTWPTRKLFMAWRSVEQQLELKVADALDGNWRFYGPMGSGAFVLRAVLARLLWLAIHPGSGYSKLPSGWAEGRFEPAVVLPCGPAIQSVGANLEKLLSGQGAAFCDWIWTLLPSDVHRFDKLAVEADLERLTYAERIRECHSE
jgi:predicted GIY-YIG superfamily endonuclease